MTASFLDPLWDNLSGFQGGGFSRIRYNLHHRNIRDNGPNGAQEKFSCHLRALPIWVQVFPFQFSSTIKRCWKSKITGTIFPFYPKDVSVTGLPTNYPCLALCHFLPGYSTGLQLDRIYLWPPERYISSSTDRGNQCLRDYESLSSLWGEAWRTFWGHRLLEIMEHLKLGPTAWLHCLSSTPRLQGRMRVTGGPHAKHFWLFFPPILVNLLVLEWDLGDDDFY